MPNIHNTALVDRNAELADDVVVGPYTLVGPGVRIGRGTVLGAHCVVEGGTTLGERNRVFHHVMLGQEPQDLKYRGERTVLRIGDHNDIRENVTMHAGTENGGGLTNVGSYNLFMIGAHVAHDCQVGDHGILANNVLLAGHVTIGDHAVISGSAAINHYVSVGRHAFVGGLSAVVHDVPPFLVTDGHPARPRGVNLIGLQRNHFEPETIEFLKRAYLTLFGRKSGSRGSHLEEVEALCGHDRCIKELLAFLRRSGDAPNGRADEQARRDDKRHSPAR